MNALITALTQPAAYPHPASCIELIETHISWVLLAGDYAYKIKKPVALPFVDFRSLAARRGFCEDEVRLNRRLAPRIYLGVVPITGNAASPRVDGSGIALEYAVKMRRFDQQALLDHLLTADALHPHLVDRLAERIATFHIEAPATTDPAFGSPLQVLQPALDNFSDLLSHANSNRRATLETLAEWTRKTFARLESVFAARHQDGRVRECHGDLHLRNIALIDGRPIPFDCIEFNAGFRWIDTINEVAFLVMDLMHRGRADFGYRFLDGYLAATGDYLGVAVLRFYLVYRALVRAKIHNLRARQAHANPREVTQLQAASDHYLALAGYIAQEKKPVLILMHGFSGAGKSRVAAALVETLGAIRVRSDIERKRLFGLNGTARSHSGVNAGLYAQQADRRTYTRLAELAETIITAGYPVILDAAFLAHWQRVSMHQLADKLGVPLWIVDCVADSDTLRDRVNARAVRGEDASEATFEVLKYQMNSHDPFTAAERDHVVHCPMEGPEADNVIACVASVVQNIDGG